MTDYKKASLVITDANSERFSIPNTVLNKPNKGDTMRLEMIGLKVFYFPFAF
jgi:hypothetical protein